MAEDVFVTGKKPIKQSSGFVAVPDWQILWNGKDITEKLNPKALCATLTEKGGKEADELSIELIDQNGDIPLPKKGDEITISIGWAAGNGLPIGLISKGKFVVDTFSITGPPDKISINAKSGNFTQNNHTRKAQKHIGKTLGQILREIATHLGASAKIDSEFENIEVPAIIKTAKSDFALLKELGKKYDAIASVKNKALIFTRHSADKTPSGKSLKTQTIDRQFAPSFTFTEEARTETNGAIATYHDRKTATKKTITHGHDANKSKAPHKLRKTHANEHDAHHAAKSHHEKSKRGVKKLELELGIGRPDIFPNTKVNVTGYKAEINAISWLVKTATHTIGASGLSTKLEMESA